MTLRKSQGYQIYIENVDPEQGYNHAKFDRSYFNGVKEKANSMGGGGGGRGGSNKEIRQMFPLNMCKHQK